MFFAILLVLFLLVCVFLCLLILIQSDKGGGISGAIGGLSGANSFLGTQDTANVLTKGTYIFGSVFLILCVLMTLFAPGGGENNNSRLKKMMEKEMQVTPMPATSFGAEGTVEDANAIFGTEATPTEAGAGAAAAEGAPAE